MGIKVTNKLTGRLFNHHLLQPKRTFFPFLFSKLSQLNIPFILGADLNACITAFGCTHNNKSGAILAQTLTNLNYILLNNRVKQYSRSLHLFTRKKQYSRSLHLFTGYSLILRWLSCRRHMWPRKWSSPNFNKLLYRNNSNWKPCNIQNSIFTELTERNLNLN